ncbi:E3 ubiquitin-protein ligase SP1 [Zea mays]|uniref:RING-type E3 ubiquitin transferase n=1 Tax=Zea mays TaxID=4577 RepID=A0A1D6F2K6_MAIZE|nr:E3 ubiquitin-protein ligase SP1 [Zea mays]
MMIPWGGVGCCLSAAALYLLGRSSGRDAEVLRSVARAGSMKDLAAILDTASKVLPLVVAVSGRVGSDTPLICQQSGMRGVIVEETAEQHFLKHNDAGSWIQDSAVMLSVSKEVPWYLVTNCRCYYAVIFFYFSNKTSNLPWTRTITTVNMLIYANLGLRLWMKMNMSIPNGNISGATIAIDTTVQVQPKTQGWGCCTVTPMDMVTPDLLYRSLHAKQTNKQTNYVISNNFYSQFATGEVFEESGRTLVRGTLDYLQGLKMLGVKRTERVLPTGISLTVVGEAIKDDVGTIRIQRPHKGPFYVSPKSIDQLIMNLGKWAKLYRLASMGFATFGAFLLAKRAIQHFLERKRRHELQKRVLNAAAQRQAREAEGSIGSSDTEPNSKKDQLVLDICVICLEQEYNAVFVP